MNFYKHHLGDYSKDTAHLSILEDGCYRRLIDMYYTTEKPLPLDLVACCRLVRARGRAECASVESVLREFFKEQEDGWHQTRCDEEIAMTHEKSEKARGSAAERWQSGGNANASKTHGKRNASHKPLATSQIPLAIKNKNNGSAQAPFLLPDWIPESHWHAWVEARTKARKPPTEYAKRLAVMKLENLRDQGHEPAQVLMQSAFNGWADLFPPKEARR